MAYQRRYFPALTITTTAYGDKSVTTDKLADKAVTSPKVAPDTIDSEHVVDESLKSVDIKDGEIKTVDIASGAITTDKIASRAVTSDKLEESIAGVSRPLTPGVDTPEIQDAKVTLAKLAPDSVDASKIKPGAVGPTELAVDAVESSRIKDGAVATAKIAGGAVDATKIAVDAVTGSEILNRSVGNLEIAVEGCHRENIRDEAVNTAKLADEAVSAAKLAESSVTSIKLATAALARRHIESLNIREAVFHDPCIGPPHGGLWIIEGDAGGVVDEYEQGRRLYTEAAIGSKQRIRLPGDMFVWTLLETLPSLNVGIGQDTYKTQAAQFVGFYKDVNNYVAFTSNSDDESPARWKAKAIKGGVPSVIDTGIEVGPAVDHVQILLIEFQGDGSIKYFINGIEKAHITDNQFIPDEKYEIRLEVEARAGVTATMIARFIDLYEKRQGE